MNCVVCLQPSGRGGETCSQRCAKRLADISRIAGTSGARAWVRARRFFMSPSKGQARQALSTALAAVRPGGTVATLYGGGVDIDQWQAERPDCNFVTFEREPALAAAMMAHARLAGFRGIHGDLRDIKPERIVDLFFVDTCSELETCCEAVDSASRWMTILRRTGLSGHAMSVCAHDGTGVTGLAATLVLKNRRGLELGRSETFRENLRVSALASSALVLPWDVHRLSLYTSPAGTGMALYSIGCTVEQQQLALREDEERLERLSSVTCNGGYKMGAHGPYRPRARGEA